MQATAHDAAEVLILELPISKRDSLLHPVDDADILNNLPFEICQILGEPADNEAGRVIRELRQENISWDFAFNQFIAPR